MKSNEPYHYCHLLLILLLLLLLLQSTKYKDPISMSSTVL